MPNTVRNRPLEPPSSATDTTAVTSDAYRRMARRLADSPCPPPSATTLVMAEPRSGGYFPRSRWETMGRKPRAWSSLASSSAM